MVGEQSAQPGQPAAAVTSFLDQGEGAVLLDSAESGPQGEPGRYPRVLVTARDIADLRGRVRVAAGAKSAVIGVFVAGAEQALALRCKPEWPTLTMLRSNASADGAGWMLVLRFARPAPVDQVVAEVGRQAVWPDRRGNQGLWLRGARKTEPDDLAATVGLAPFDERVVNPIGFSADVEPVRLTWDGSAGEAAREAVRMATSGVPLSSDRIPGEARELLGQRLAGVIEAGAAIDLGDRLRCEQHSIRLRRAALDEHSLGAWRRNVGAANDVRVAPRPTVSVVMATKRPDRLEHALSQVLRQRGCDVELVLAPHGFTPNKGEVREIAGELPITVRPAAKETVFGDVLASAVAAASGDLVLKMDDDDWYSSDFIADLLRAREYSGAELVGSIPTFTYLEASDQTVESGAPTEKYTNFVAGGTLMIGRSDLLALGNFRSVRRWVDAQLLAAVWEAGGAIYRGHGLGYALRRTGSGHTWESDDQAVIDEPTTIAVHPGFHVSSLMELDSQSSRQAR